MPLFLFILFYCMIFIHSFNHIHTVHLSVAIRRGLSPYLHRWSAQWKNLPVVPSRESNSGLPHSKPTLYHWATPHMNVTSMFAYVCILFCLYQRIHFFRIYFTVYNIEEVSGDTFKAVPVYLQCTIYVYAWWGAIKPSWHSAQLNILTYITLLPLPQRYLWSIPSIWMCI